MRPDLALVDQAFLRLMDELDRVFDGQNVRVLVFIDVIDHRRQRRRLAGTSWAGHQHDAARIFGDILEDFRTVQIFQGQDLRRNGSENRPRTTVLVEGIDPEPCQIRDFEGEVTFQRLFVDLALGVVHDVVHHAVHILVLHRRQVDPAHVAMNADHRRQA